MIDTQPQAVRDESPPAPRPATGLAGRALGRFLLLRIVQAIGVVLAAFTAAFAVLRMIPGDPALLILGGTSASVAPTAGQLAAVHHQYGFDRPLIVQYFLYLGHALHGDFGVSYQTGIPVTDTLRAALPSTLELAGAALVFALLLGVLLGCLAQFVECRWGRSLLQALPSMAVSMPTFLVGILLIEVVSFNLGWLPAFGSQGVRSLVLPAFSMAVPGAGLVAQVLSRGLAAALQEPYVAVILATGAGRLRTFSHALRSALLPTVTILGVVAAEMVALSTVTETVFSRYGIGSVMTEAVKFRDVPLVLAITMLIVVVFVLVTIAVDLSYPVIDPRLRRGLVPMPKRVAARVGAR